MFEQDRVIVRLQQRILLDKAIVVCYLAGSYGRGTADSYSDLDVVLLFADQISRNQAYDRRREFVQSVLPYVPAKSFDASHVMPYLHIALYSNGAKVDYHFEIVSNTNQVNSNEHIRLLKDTIGWAERLKSLTAVSPPVVKMPAVSSKTLLDIDNRFWVMFIDIYRLLLRGDSDKSYPIYLDLLHFTIPQILPLLVAGSPTRLNLIDAYFSQEASVTLEHLRELLPAYLVARAELVSQYDLSFIPNENFERNIITLIQKT